MYPISRSHPKTTNQSFNPLAPQQAKAPGNDVPRSEMIPIDQYGVQQTPKNDCHDSSGQNPSVDVWSMFVFFALYNWVNGPVLKDER